MNLGGNNGRTNQYLEASKGGFTPAWRRRSHKRLDRCERSNRACRKYNRRSRLNGPDGRPDWRLNGLVVLRWPVHMELKVLGVRTECATCAPRAQCTRRLVRGRVQYPAKIANKSLTRDIQITLYLRLRRLFAYLFTASAEIRIASCAGSSAGRHVLELSATWPIKKDSDGRPARRYVCMAESCLAVRPRAKLECPRRHGAVYRSGLFARRLRTVATWASDRR